MILYNIVLIIALGLFGVGNVDSATPVAKKPVVPQTEKKAPETKVASDIKTDVVKTPADTNVPPAAGATDVKESGGTGVPPAAAPSAAPKPVDKSKILDTIKSFFSNILKTVKETINNTDYDKSTFSIIIRLKVGQEVIPVGITYDFGMAGSGFDEKEVEIENIFTGAKEKIIVPAVPVEKGFLPVEAKIWPEKVAGLVSTKVLIEGLIKTIPPLQEIFDNLLHVRGDMSFFIKVALLFITVLRNPGQRWPTALSKLEYVTEQMMFLLKRLANTMDEDETRKAQGLVDNKGFPDDTQPIDVSGKKPIVLFKGPGNIILRLARMFQLEPLFVGNQAIKIDFPETAYWYFDMRAGKPPTDLEMKLGAAFMTAGYEGQTQALYSTILPLITNKLDYFDRELLLKGLTAHVGNIKKGLDKGIAKRSRESTQDFEARLSSIAAPKIKERAVGTKAKPGLIPALTEISAAMKAAKTFGPGKPGSEAQPSQPDLLAAVEKLKASVQAEVAAAEVIIRTKAPKAKPGEAADEEDADTAVAPAKKTDASAKKAAAPVVPPVAVPEASSTKLVKVEVLKILDILWSMLNDRIINKQFKGDPRWVYKGYIKLSYFDLMIDALALGFRTLNELSIATKEALKTPEGKAKYAAMAAKVTPKMDQARKDYLAAAAAYKQTASEANKEALAKQKGLLSLYSRELLWVQIKFKATFVLLFKYPRVKDLPPENLLTFLKREIVYLFLRTQHYEVFRNAIDRFLKPMGISLEELVPDLQGAAEEVQSKEEEALLAPVGGDEFGGIDLTGGADAASEVGQDEAPAVKPVVEEEEEPVTKPAAKKQTAKASKKEPVVEEEEEPVAKPAAKKQTAKASKKEPVVEEEPAEEPTEEVGQEAGDEEELIMVEEGDEGSLGDEYEEVDEDSVEAVEEDAVEEEA